MDRQQLCQKSLRDRDIQLRQVSEILSQYIQCTCDLDNWQPEQSTGHSHVCKIHKAANAVVSRTADADWALRAAAPTLVEALRKIATEPDYTNPEEMVRIARGTLRLVDALEF